MRDKDLRKAMREYRGLYCVPCFETLSKTYACAEKLGIFSDDLSEQPTLTIEDRKSVV